MSYSLTPQYLADELWLVAHVTLKSRLGVTHDHWKWYRLIDHIRVLFVFHCNYMAESCIVFEIKRNIGQKTPIFHTPFHLACTITYNPLEFLSKILTQVHQQDAYPTNAGVRLLCAKTSALSRATFPSLTSTQAIEHDVCARLPNITSASCDLWPPDPRSTVHTRVPGKDLCQFTLKSVHSFSKYSFHNSGVNPGGTRGTRPPKF